MSDLTERLHRAIDALGAMASDPLSDPLEAARLRGKIEGVKLALSYIHDADPPPVTPLLSDRSRE